MTPLIDMIASWSPDLPMSQLANLHTIFNIVTTAIVLFIDAYMLKIIYKIEASLECVGEINEDYKLP